MLFLREGNQYYCLVKVHFFANKHSETLRENPFKRKFPFTILEIPYLMSLLVNTFHATGLSLYPLKTKPLGF